MSRRCPRWPATPPSWWIRPTWTRSPTVSRGSSRTPRCARTWRGAAAAAPRAFRGNGVRVKPSPCTAPSWVDDPGSVTGVAEAADVRASLLRAALAGGVAVVALTEALSALGALTRGPLVAGWSIVALAGLLVV